MSEMSERAREASKDKARRMTETDPHQKIGVTSWTPPEPMNADKQTGMRPISRTYRKRGGKVEGEHEKRRADRKPRASGGRSVANAIATTNEPDANEDIYGRAHVGAYRDGGRARAKRMMGGPLAPNIADQGRMSFQNGPSQMSRAFGIKKGGRVKRASGGKTEADNPKSLKVEHVIVKKAKGGAVSGTDPVGDRIPRKDGGGNWIAGATKNKGALHRELGVPEGKKIPAKKLAKAEHSKNPTERKRADLAATLKGLNKAKGGEVREAHAKGGRAGKGKMSVNIVIAGGGHPQAPAGGMPPPAPHPAAPVPMPQQGMPMGMAPPMMPPGMPMGAGMPPGMPPGMMGRPGMPPMPPGGMGMPGAGMPPMMPRKRGGSVKAEVKMEDGAGGGLGRLEKIRKYGDNAHP